MKARLWQIAYGPEWHQSVSTADPGDGYFEDDMEACHDALGLAPFTYSHQFLDRDDVRIFTTSDELAGYRVVVFLRIEREVTRVTLEWVMLEPLEPDLP
ncbi:MAG: hypothetical protein JWQ18_1559 [Conexibacter sp.]|nr:hypothetical protein [Conexibacter sp.]